MVLIMKKPGLSEISCSTAYFLMLILVSIHIVSGCNTASKSDKINRFDVVNRHNIQLEQVDTLGSLSVGNGEFAFTADITGMQTFFEAYENGVSLGTQSQWAWHTIPSDSDYTLADAMVYYESCNGKSVPYAVQHTAGRPARAANWLRANPHRLHMGIIGLSMVNAHGEEVTIADIQNPKQSLNLWTGKLESYFEIDGETVLVETLCHQESDQLSFRITSNLILRDQLKIIVKFPYGKDCHVCPGYDWENEYNHTSEIMSEGNTHAIIQRTLDSTSYFVRMEWSENVDLNQKGRHVFEVKPTTGNRTFEYSISFAPQKQTYDNATFEATENNNLQHWEKYWMSGGAIDFSASTDPRAHELERRVVLSQYLMKIQCSGSLPPQETGLTFNSWYGKFHIEMHWWHAAHFALWGRTEYLAKSMGWYFDNMEDARKIARRQGYEGVRWQKMTSPQGQSSPSGVGEFLIWQQPHIIYFAELIYRDNPSDETLNKYKNLVFETADFMASFAQLSEDDGHYHLCPPLIPAQEHFKATETSDPAFELTYWNWGLTIAQKWRERLGMGTDTTWQKVIDYLAPIPENETYYLPTREATDAFTNMEKRRDHPIVTGAYGMLPNKKIQVSKMSDTFDEVMREWNWQSTWGWDYPLLAMSATRLNKPDAAIDALFTETQKNTYLVNGHNYQDGRLRIYLPGNGGLLAAVAMMAAGFEGSTEINPGFPKDGSWNIRWEGLQPVF
jgi:protein-glucosylgalactosylhydroxylysine glucosidase